MNEENANLGDVRTEMRPTSDLNLADFMSRPPDEWPKLITWEELTPGSFEPSFSGYTAAHYCTGNPELGWCLYSRGAGGCWNQRTKQQVSPVAGASPVQHEGRWFWATSTPKAERSGVRMITESSGGCYLIYHEGDQCQRSHCEVETYAQALQWIEKHENDKFICYPLDEALVTQRTESPKELNPNDTPARSVPHDHGGGLFEALSHAIIARILEAEANCDPPHDILLRLESIIRERDSLRTERDTARDERDRLIKTLEGRAALELEAINGIGLENDELRARVEELEKKHVPTWKVKHGEASTGYNAAIFRDVYDDVVGVAERERLQKLDDSPSRRKNYAKESHWQCQIVNGLVSRIMNLRLMVAELEAANKEVWDKAIEIAREHAVKNGLGWAVLRKLEAARNATQSKEETNHGNESPELAGQPTGIKATRTVSEDLTIEEIDRILEYCQKASPGPYFVGHDRAADAPDHTDSGLALVDTGRSGDWPIARLCEWPQAHFIAGARADLPRLAQQLKRMMQKQIQGDEGQELATPTTETQPT